MTLRVDRLDHLVLNVRDVERAAKVVRTCSWHWEVPDISKCRVIGNQLIEAEAREPPICEV